MLLSKLAAMFLAISFFTTPVSSLAATGALPSAAPKLGGLTGALSKVSGISFGGLVTFVNPVPCTTPLGAFFFIVVPLGFTPYAGPILWMPASKPNPATFGAPPLPSVSIVGKVLSSVPIPCVVGTTPIGYGIPIMPVPGFGTSLPGKVK